MMRILIYGFGPYLGYRHNVTETIIRQLPNQRGIEKEVFPVTFHRGQFIKAVRETKPDLVLGLGQCSGGRLLRIERRAINRKRKNKDTKPLRILGDGKQHLTTHLQWKLGNAARRSDNAGDYVCNFSMYVILDYLKRRQMDTRFGFLHVPHNYDTKKAVRLLTRTIRQLRRLDSKSPAAEAKF